MDYLTSLSGLIILVDFCFSQSQLDVERYKMFSCPSVDTCDFEEDIQSKLSETKCPCDAICSMYGECCSNSTSKNLDISTLSCLFKNSSSFLGVRAISKCPRKFRGLEEYKWRCEGIRRDINDPAVIAPVTNPITGITYLNSFCARCHREKVSNLKMWDVVFMCRDLDAGSPYKEGHLTYHSDYRIWAIFHKEEWNVCDLRFQLPKDVGESIRYCRRGIVDSCLYGWRGSEVENRCKSSKGIVYVEMQAYRNKYCALCNNIPYERLSCNPQPIEETHSKFLVIRVDMNRDEDWGEPCDTSERYDLFFVRCRNIDEAIKGYALVEKG